LSKRQNVALVTSLALACLGCSRKPAEVAVREDSSAYRVYVTNETTGDMSIIDSAALNVIATVPLGKRPRGIHASPDRKTIYVALSGSPIAGPGVDESTLPPPDKEADGIGVFDVAQNKLVRLIKSGSDPEEFDLSKDGKLLYVSNEDVSGVTILDIAAGKVLNTLPVGGEPEGVKVTPDGKQVWVTSEETGAITVIDTAAAKVIKSFKVGRRPRTIAFLPDGSRAYVNAENDGTVVVVDAVKHAAIQTIALGEAGVVKPMAVLLGPNAAKLYVSTGRGRNVAIVDTAANKVEASVEVGQRPWGIALSPDGKTLYTANGPSKDVSVVDLATRTVIRKIPVSGSPWGVITLDR
jgi:YVTN family beta-propeller protein